jgi:Concanavalin A-like lectin/glucanases superfamily
LRSYKDDLERARLALRPPENAYERLLERRDRKRRNNRIAAGVLGLVIASAGFLVTVRAFTDGSEELSPASCAPNQADITHWWPGDGSGADVVAGRSATLHGGATFGPGLVGQAFVLDGVDDFVSVPDDPALDVGTRDFTIALWVNFDSTEGEQILVEDWVQHSLEPEIVWGWTFTKFPDNHVSFAVAERMEPTYAEADSGLLDIPLHTWIHFAARRRGDTVEILMNGDVVASGTTSIAGTLDADTRSSIKFGHRGAPQDTPGSVSDQGFFLNGRVDEVKLVIGRALSNREIRAIVEVEASGKRC